MSSDSQSGGPAQYSDDEDSYYDQSNPDRSSVVSTGPRVSRANRESKINSGKPQANGKIIAHLQQTKNNGDKSAIQYGSAIAPQNVLDQFNKNSQSQVYEPVVSTVLASEINEPEQRLNKQNQSNEQREPIVNEYSNGVYPQSTQILANGNYEGQQNKDQMRQPDQQTGDKQLQIQNKQQQNKIEQQNIVADMNIKKQEEVQQIRENHQQNKQQQVRQQHIQNTQLQLPRQTSEVKGYQQNIQQVQGEPNINNDNDHTRTQQQVVQVAQTQQTQSQHIQAGMQYQPRLNNVQLGNNTHVQAQPQLEVAREAENVQEEQLIQNQQVKQNEQNLQKLQKQKYEANQVQAPEQTIGLQIPQEQPQRPQQPNNPPQQLPTNEHPQPQSPPQPQPQHQQPPQLHHQITQQTQQSRNDQILQPQPQLQPLPQPQNRQQYYRQEAISPQLHSGAQHSLKDQFGQIDNTEVEKIEKEEQERDQQERIQEVMGHIRDDEGDDSNQVEQIEVVQANQQHPNESNTQYQIQQHVTQEVLEAQDVKIGAEIPQEEAHTQTVNTIDNNNNNKQVQETQVHDTKMAQLVDPGVTATQQQQPIPSPQPYPPQVNQLGGQVKQQPSEQQRKQQQQQEQQDQHQHQQPQHQQQQHQHQHQHQHVQYQQHQQHQHQHQQLQEQHHQHQQQHIQRQQQQQQQWEHHKQVVRAEQQNTHQPMQMQPKQQQPHQANNTLNIQPQQIWANKPQQNNWQHVQQINQQKVNHNDIDSTHAHVHNNTNVEQQLNTHHIPQHHDSPHQQSQTWPQQHQQQHQQTQQNQTWQQTNPSHDNIQPHQEHPNDQQHKQQHQPLEPVDNPQSERDPYLTSEVPESPLPINVWTKVQSQELIRQLPQTEVQANQLFNIHNENNTVNNNILPETTISHQREQGHPHEMKYENDIIAAQLENKLADHNNMADNQHSNKVHDTHEQTQSKQMTQACTQIGTQTCQPQYHQTSTNQIHPIIPSNQIPQQQHIQQNLKNQYYSNSKVIHNRQSGCIYEKVQSTNEPLNSQSQPQELQKIKQQSVYNVTSLSALAIQRKSDVQDQPKNQGKIMTLQSVQVPYPQSLQKQQSETDSMKVEASQNLTPGYLSPKLPTSKISTSKISQKSNNAHHSQDNEPISKPSQTSGVHVKSKIAAEEQNHQTKQDQLNQQTPNEATTPEQARQLDQPPELVLQQSDRIHHEQDKIQEINQQEFETSKMMDRKLMAASFKEKPQQEQKAGPGSKTCDCAIM